MTKHILSFAKRMKKVLNPQENKRPWETYPRPAELSEQIIMLTAEEAAWVNVQSRRVMRLRRREAARKRALGVPPPPTPGNIAYAVYM